MEKLTVIVNCTDRKSQVPSPQLRLRSLPPCGLDARFDIWQSRLDRAETTVKLVDLYQGEAWQQARYLAADAAKEGVDVTLLVASAGLGLRDVTTDGPAYAATFARGHLDSVASDQDETRAWWKRLATLNKNDEFVEAVGKRVLLVLSANYARAMDDDLVALAERGGDLLLVGGARTIPGLPRIAADGSLRRELGGSRLSLTLRMARAWLARRPDRGRLYSDRGEAAWADWARSVSHTECYDRRPMSDEELTKLIYTLRRTDPALSATRALRQIRDDGIACEQKRFGQLFHAATGAS